MVRNSLKYDETMGTGDLILKSDSDISYNYNYLIYIIGWSQHTTTGWGEALLISRNIISSDVTRYLTFSRGLFCLSLFFINEYLIWQYNTCVATISWVVGR